MSVSGQVVIVNEGKANTQIIPFPIVTSANTTQQYDVDVTLPVLGLPLRGQASVQLASQAKTLYFAQDVHVAGHAENITLHGPAGDAMFSVKVDWPVQGGSFDPAAAAISIRGTGGTGMFDGVKLSGDLKGIFRPTGALYLSYPSRDAALEAVQRGLAQNAALSDAQRLEALQQARQALVQANVADFPLDDIPQNQAVVMSAIERNGTQLQVALRITVPAGEAHQTVKVMVVGPNGPAKTVYQGVHAPHETVSASATSTPPFVVQVYVAGNMARQITVPAAQ